MSNIIYRCQSCGSSTYMRERRPNGYTTCCDCNFTCLSSEWDSIEVCKLEEKIDNTSIKITGEKDNSLRNYYVNTILQAMGSRFTTYEIYEDDWLVELTDFDKDTIKKAIMLADEVVRQLGE